MVSFSVLIITHGREELLIKCLESLREAAPFELVVFENGIPLSESLRKFLATYPAELRMGGAPTQLSPGQARNEALLLATGEWIHFIDDDSYWLQGYWETVKAIITNPGVDVLGGPDGPARDMNTFQVSVALALASPLCTGMTYGRHLPVGNALTAATEERLTSCNLWIRRELLGEKPFPEDFRRAEETILLQRLQHEGRRMFYHPRLRVGHYRRKNIRSLLTPMLGAGYWRSRLLRRSKEAGAMYWLPAIFVLLHLTLLFDPKIFFNLARIYTLLIVWVSVGICLQRKHPGKILHVVILHYLIVFFYGAGFILERVGYRWK